MTLLGGGGSYVRWHVYKSPIYPPLFLNSNLGRAWALVNLSHCGNSGAAKICQRRAKARERSDRAGGGCGREVPPSHGREIF